MQIQTLGNQVCFKNIFLLGIIIKTLRKLYKIKTKAYHRIFHFIQKKNNRMRLNLVRKSIKLNIKNQIKKLLRKVKNYLKFRSHYLKVFIDLIL